MISKRFKLASISTATIVALSLGFIPTLGSIASAAAKTSSTTGSSTSSSSSSSANQQARLQNIISKGDQEIERRLTSLGTLNSKINAAVNLTPSDKTALSGEVSSTTSGLTTLKTQLDSATTVSTARTDVTNIYSEYRVYALVVPKVELVKVADDQQVVETKLSTLAQKLQSRITTAESQGKNVTTMQSELANMNSEISSSKAISSSIETGVINLQPSDYNSNHAVLEGDNTQLKTAHSDNMTAYSDAKQIVVGLKAL